MLSKSKYNKMKKVLNSTLMMLLIVLSLSACSKQEDEKEKDKENPGDNELYISKSHNGAFDGDNGSEGELWANMNYTDGSIIPL